MLAQKAGLEEDPWEGVRLRPDDSHSRRELTMDELKRRRIVAMVRRELGREKIAMQFAHTKNAVSANGIKGLLFTDNELTKLKAMDYALLGWKAVKMFIKFRNRKRN